MKGLTLFILGLAALAYVMSSAASSSAPDLTQRVATLEKEVKSQADDIQLLKVIVGLEGNEALPQGLQFRVKGKK